MDLLSVTIALMYPAKYSWSKVVFALELLPDLQGSPHSNGKRSHCS
jgi:hypothetical protein